ncbi:MAG TPA: hypothetical protein VLS90_06100, partial [Thermodesulfobacteriota bacterium]|nr:hypothetical protein [Thermodesulfobacteriota bacterium]
GVELRPGFDGRRNAGAKEWRVVLLAAHSTGYRGLCRIVSRRRGAGGRRGGKGFLGKDPVPFVLAEPDGLFALSDDPVAVRSLIEGGFPRDRAGLLVVRPGHSEGETGRLDAARALGIRPVADLDSVFLDEADQPLHALLSAVRQGRRISHDPRGSEAENPGRRLRPPGEAAALFADLPEAVAGAEAVAASCRFDLASVRERVRGMAPAHAGEQLRSLCGDLIVSKRERGEPWTDAHQARLEEELSAFEKTGYSQYPLFVAEIVGHCRGNGIPVVARGSAASSLTLHLLGASPIDPLPHGLIFERFLHAGKSSPPDIDLDLSWDRRDEVIEWAYEWFGRDKAAMVGAHHTFQRRSALREGLKAWGARPALVDALGKSLPPEDLEIREVDFLDLADTAEEKEPTAAPAPFRQALPLIQRLIGKPHHTAAHPGGLIIGDAPLEDFLPLEKAPKGVVVTQYDLAALDSLGIVKIDLLGNRFLSELEETLTLAGAGNESIPPEDPETIELVDRAGTVGCFQLESPAMRSLLARIPIRRQSDIVNALALIRPGAAAGEAKSSYIRRARGEEPETLFDPAMADRLSETHGMLLYEEDILVLLSRLGALTLGEADEMRAAIVRSGGDAETLSALESRFVQAAIRKGIEEARTRRAWTASARFAAYSFNKAHSVSYGRLAYLSAYLKAHHLTEFACALLNHHEGFYPLRTLAGEMSRLGVEMRAPHVNESSYPSLLEPRRGGGAAVRIGLGKVKVLSIPSTASLLEQRGRGPFADLRDMLERVRIPLREISALVLCGACDGLQPLSRENYPFAHEAVLAALKEGKKPAETGGVEIRGAEGDAAKISLYQSLVRVRNELKYLGMHVS